MITPFSIYLHSSLNKKINCESPLLVKDQILGLMLIDKAEKKEFAKCFNKFHKKSSVPSQFRGEEFFVDKTKIKLIEKIPSKSTELLDIFNKVTTKIENQSILYHLIGKLKKHQSILARLIESFIYMRMANHSKAQKIIMEMISKDFFSHLLRSDIVDIPLKKQKEQFISLLKAFEEDLNNKKIVTALVFYLYFYTNGDFSEALDYEFEIPHSLREVRNHYRSNRFGKTLPYVWGPSIFENSSQKEYLSYLEKTTLFKELKNGKITNLLFYRSTNHINKEELSVVLSKVKKIENSTSLIDQYVFYELVSDDIFYKFITAHTDLKLGVISNGKRKFLKDVLNNTLLKQYAVYSLIELGDIQEDYFFELLNE